MKTTFTFTILRYVHDIATGEFVNMGVAMYAADAKYISAICNARYGRLSKVFLEVDVEHLRSLMRYIQARFEEYSAKLTDELALEGYPKSIIEIAQSILPKDDSSLQWSEPSGGITEDPAATLDQLYSRLVERYEQRVQQTSRNDDEVWRYYKKELEAKQVLARLQPKRIIGKDYEHEFEHAWKNGVWNLFQPVSMDLLDSDSILDKANRWLGRSTNLRESNETFRLVMLLGEPRIEKLRPAYAKALNILQKMPVEKELVTEQGAEKFSEQLAQEIAAHPPGK
ncbi:MAG: DUF3037 domain-containing protein [Verrucomicrobiia bacterium]